MFTFLRSNSAFCKPRTLVVVANGRYVTLPAVGIFIIYMVHMFMANVHSSSYFLETTPPPLIDVCLQPAPRPHCPQAVHNETNPNPNPNMLLLFSSVVYKHRLPSLE